MAKDALNALEEGSHPMPGAADESPWAFSFQNPQHQESYRHYWHQVSQRPLPEGIQQKLTHELQRLSNLSPYGTEAAMIRTYIETVLSLPWPNRPPAADRSELSLNTIAASLDEDHYGLNDVKERVLEYLAVQQLTREPQSTILCLVGPPGVGKTSFAKSIAHSIGRQFAYVPLGGVQDPAEIRGHRRTTIGALPGRIIQALQKTQSMNPVIVLDEIEKMVSTHYGDPEAALLEVLDPCRNNQFIDHYLDVPVDLSQVLFIATANSLYGLSRAMKDRLEVIRISGYTDFEKERIAERFLFPKLLKAHGLTDQQVKLSPAVLRHIIHHYTREAGVRELERMLAKVCRKSAMAVVRSPRTQMTLKQPEDLKPCLGVERFTWDPCPQTPTVGLVNGLAWTGDGGDLLQIESNRVNGKGKLTITGSIGHVMLESAQAALSFIRSHTDPLAISARQVDQSDFHIHLPDGATPKDGPSAGMALAISLISALSGTPVQPKVAMTGEMTIRGRILPIGGLKEKCLAAIRMNLHTIIVPEGNAKDLEELPQDVRDQLTFITVRHIEEALPHVLVSPTPPAETAPQKTRSRQKRNEPKPSVSTPARRKKVASPEPDNGPAHRTNGG